MVLRAGAGSARALQQLCGLYWDPAYTYLRRRGLGPQDAREQTQAFFEGLLRRDDLARLTRDGGRFRSWLLVALRRHHGRGLAAAQAAKRSHTEVADPEPVLARETDDGLDPEQAYQRQWALSLLGAARRRVREAYAERGREAHFDALFPTLSGDGATTAELAEQLGMKAGAVRVAAHRLGRRYGEAVREEVADTLEEGASLDEELAELMAAVGGEAPI